MHQKVQSAMFWDNYYSTITSPGYNPQLFGLAHATATAYHHQTFHKKKSAETGPGSSMPQITAMFRIIGEFSITGTEDNCLVTLSITNHPSSAKAKC